MCDSLFFFNDLTLSFIPRFDAEMRKMEEDMDRFRTDLMDRESDFFKRATKTRYGKNAIMVVNGEVPINICYACGCLV